MAETALRDDFEAIDLSRSLRRRSVNRKGNYTISGYISGWTDEIALPTNEGANTAIFPKNLLPQVDTDLVAVFIDQPLADYFRIKPLIGSFDKVFVGQTPHHNIEIDFESSAAVFNENEISLSDANTEDTEEAEARTMLRAIVDAPSRELNRLFEALSTQIGPQIILSAALNEYRSSGRERFISMAVSVLQTLGDKAWPALRNLARLAPEEAELFVPIIADCTSVGLDERIDALIHLAGSRHANVRAAALEHLYELPKEGADAIVRIVPKGPR